MITLFSLVIIILCFFTLTINNTGSQDNFNRREPYSFRDYKSIDPDTLNLSLTDALSHLLNDDGQSFSD